MRLITTTVLALALLSTPVSAFAPSQVSGRAAATTRRDAKGLSIGDISGGGGKPAAAPRIVKGVTQQREKPKRSVPDFKAPSLPSFSAKKPPLPPPPKPAFKAPKLPKLPKGESKVKLPAAPGLKKGISRVGETKQFTSKVDRQVNLDPLKQRDGVSFAATPSYAQTKDDSGGAAAAVPVVAVLAAGALAVGVLGGANDGTVDVTLPSDPVALASKAAAGKPVKARLAGLPLLPAQDISISVDVGAASDSAPDVVIDANGGIGAGLKILAGAVKANVNGSPVDVGIGLSKGEAAINVKADVIPGVKLPFKPSTTTDWEQVVKLSDGTVSYRNARTGQTASQLPENEKAIFGVRPCFVTSFNGCAE